MDIYSIGFTQKTAAQFFGTLKDARIQRLVDVRLNNVSQLAGFAKRDDLAFFLRELCGAEYVHQTLLAPEQAMLDTYKKARGNWKDYEREFLALMAARRVQEKLDPDSFRVRTVLLCSEPTAEKCHRRLVIEYLAGYWPDVTAVHL